MKTKKEKSVTVRFETNLNASMTMQVYPASDANIIKQVLKQFPDAFNIEI